MKESDKIKVCKTMHYFWSRTMQNNGSWCVCLSLIIYIQHARLQQEGIGQRWICHSRLLWICHSKSSDLSSRFDALLLLSISVYTAGHFVQRGGAGGNGAASRNTTILVEIPPSTMVVQPVHRDGLDWDSTASCKAEPAWLLCGANKLRRDGKRSQSCTSFYLNNERTLQVPWWFLIIMPKWTIKLFKTELFNNSQILVSLKFLLCRRSPAVCRGLEWKVKAVTSSPWTEPTL